jgi:hypothetical protein
MISAIRVDRLDPPDEVVAFDPQVHTLSCMFCQAVQKSPAALALHLSRIHSNRSDFPVLFFGRVEDPTGSAAIAKHVLQQIDQQLFVRMKMKAGRGRSVSAFQRVTINILCRPGASDSIVQSFNFKPQWTPSGMLIVDGANGDTIRTLLGPNCLERDFGSYKSIIDPADSIKFVWAPRVIKDHLNIRRREVYFLKLRLNCKSQQAVRAPRIQRSIQ